jgi:hypothetical protein
VEKLCSVIGEKYDYILKNVPLYSKRKRLVGEIDVLAFKNNSCDIYEVKCSYRISKAKRQLEKIRKLIGAQSKVRNSFFFCGDSESLVWI